MRSVRGPPTTMQICLVSDRRRLGQAQNRPSTDWIALLVAQVAAASQAGIDYVQIREADLEARDLAMLVRRCLDVTRGTITRLLVNDRVDVALACGAGVQLKERSSRPADVRRIAPAGFLIGASVHTPAGAEARKGADLLIAGTVRPTASKSGVEYLDEDGLRAIVEVADGRPVLGIGGLNLDSIPLLKASGAAGMAAVGAFIPEAHHELRTFVQNRVNDLRFAFDSA